jgi:phosphoribosylamine--glycine ligase
MSAAGPRLAPRRILVVGGGGREHALAWKLAGEPGVEAVSVAPGSAAMAAEDRVRVLPAVDPLDPPAVLAAARATSAELVVVGPEAPLAAGVADALEAAGVAVCGPIRAAARLETSKAFCHEVAAAAGVRMARAEAFRGGEVEPARAFIGTLAGDGAGIVLKADGLAAGKGVVVTDSADRALELLPSFLVGRPPGEPALVIEERLAGREASVIAICDGNRAVALPAARDHKRLADGDRGPNTGGMGAYSPLPDLDGAAVGAILETVHRPLLAEMARRGTPFRGFLYAGLMLTATGPVLLECNVRLGDPEAQVILPRLGVDLGPLLLAAAGGLLPAALPALLPSLPGAAVGIVLAAAGYPGDPRRGDPIRGLDAARDGGALVFHAGTRRLPDGGFATHGGRVVTVVGRGATLGEARAAAERGAGAIVWDGLQRRRDIAAELPPAVTAPGPAAAAAAGTVVGAAAPEMPGARR